MPNKQTLRRWALPLAFMLTMAVAGLAIAQNEAPQPTPRPVPTTPPPERDYRPSEEVSPDDEVDFPADL